jgi:hypothetical protein
MAKIVRSDARRSASAPPAELVVAVDIGAKRHRAPVAQIWVRVRDRLAARRIARGMTRGLGAAAAVPAGHHAVIRVPSRRTLERLGPDVGAAIAVVPVRAKNLRRLAEIVERLREGGAAGVQLAWDGRDPPRSVAEARVFAILERARATPALPPVVLAAGEAPVEALRILIAHRTPRG